MASLAVVTGAGSGIGRAVASRLAESGYRIALSGRRPGPLEETVAVLSGSEHSIHPGDLSIPTEVEAVAAGIVHRHGVVAAVVHCAGGLVERDDGSLAAHAEELIDAFRSNVLTAALLTEALAPHMSDGRGRIVAMSSIAALRGGGGSYSTAKSALHGWAFDLARRLGRRGITVNVIAPGYTTGTEFFGTGMTDERHRRLVEEALVGRAGEPADIAAAVEFLVSPDAKHVTGQVIQVNGGSLVR